jgi:hypothetical protein
VRAHAAAPDDDDERVPELVEALGGQEDSVARQLFENQLVVEVAGLRPPREGFVSEVFLVGFGGAAEASQLSLGSVSLRSIPRR